MHIGDIDDQTFFDLVVVGEGGEGGEFAPLGALAVVEVEKGQFDLAGGERGSDAGVEAAADQGDSQVHFNIHSGKGNWRIA